MCGVHVMILAVAACLALPVQAGDPPWIARSTSGMVAADSPEASQAGAEILKAGGNAFDAAIATSLALGVCRPESTGLGGGGFLVAYAAKEKRFIALDFRETAPAAATPERYAKLEAECGKGPSASVYGGNAVATPGLPAGLDEIRRRFGTKSFAELAAPAVKVAEEGFVIDEHFRSSCEDLQREFKKYDGLQSHSARLADHFLKGDRRPVLGEKFRRPGFADTLRMLARDGVAPFYDGPIAAAIVKVVHEAGGDLRAEDLRGYRVKEREPLIFIVGEHRFVTMPPPSSGGFCISQMCQLTCGENTEPRCPDFNSRLYSHHLFIEVMKHAFADRARWLGDPDFIQVPLNYLGDDKQLDKISRMICKGPYADPQQYGAITIPDDAGTSHFCIADAAGNIVSMTETINGNFGSLVMTEPYDIVLNNQIDDFTTVPGKANLFGLTQSERNLVAPGKRPLSSMSPTIVLQDGRPVLAIGGSGGPRIISNVFQVMQAVLKGKTLEQAETELRLHHQWQPDEIYLDRDPPKEMQEIIEQLKQRGHKFSDKRKGAAVQAIQFLADGTMVGASDPAKGGRPVGLR